MSRGLKFLFVFFISVSAGVQADPRFFDVAQKLKVYEAQSSDPRLLTLTLEAFRIQDGVLESDFVWNLARPLYSAQSILYHIFEDLLRSDENWIRYLKKLECVFASEARATLIGNQRREALRNSVAVALALYATGSLQAETVREMSRRGDLIQQVVEWMGLHLETLLQHRMIENWDLSVLDPREPYSQIYKGELHWMRERLLQDEQGRKLYQKEDLDRLTQEFLRSQKDLGLKEHLGDHELATLSEFLILRAPAREKDFLDSVQNRLPQLLRHLRKSGLRELYQRFFFWLKNLQLNKSKSLEVRIESEKRAHEELVRREEARLKLGIEFQKALEAVTGPALHLKDRRNQLVELVLDVYLAKPELPWGALLQNSSPEALVIFVISQIDSVSALRDRLKSLFDYERLQKEVLRIKVHHRKTENKLETSYPLDKCRRALAIL
jgi:hypothetical protein